MVHRKLPHRRREQSSQTAMPSSTNNAPSRTSSSTTAAQIRTETLQEFFASTPSTTSHFNSPTSIAVASPLTPDSLSLFGPLTTTTSPTSSPSPTSSQSMGLTPAAKAGIGVGVTLAGVFFILTLVLLKLTHLQNSQGAHRETQDTKRPSFGPREISNIDSSKWYVSRNVKGVLVGKWTETPRPMTGNGAGSVSGSGIEETPHSPVVELLIPTPQSLFSNEGREVPRSTLSSAGGDQSYGVYEMDGGIWAVNPQYMGPRSIHKEKNRLIWYLRNLLADRSRRGSVGDNETKSETAAKKGWHTAAVELQGAVLSSFSERGCDSREGLEAPRSNFTAVESDGVEGPFEMDGIPAVENARSV